MLRSLDLANFAASPIPFTIYLAGHPFIYATLAAGPSHFAWDGRQVFYAGETLHIHTNDAGIGGAASGYLLPDP